METENNWDKLVINALKANKEFQISHIKNLESLLSTFFDKELYSEILKLIKVHDLEKIRSLQVIYDFADEYLDVIQFSDQDNRVFIATVYDSIELWQDPEVLDLFLIS